MKPRTTNSREWPIDTCRNGHIGTTSKDIKWQPICTRHDGSLHEVRESPPKFLEFSFAYCIMVSRELGLCLWNHRICFEDNLTRLINKYVESLRAFLGTHLLTPTAYYLATNGHAERLDETIIAVILHYMYEHNRNWNSYAHLLTYAHNAQERR